MTAAHPRVLFVCVENSCRSQMAEGFARGLAGDRFDVSSGGSKPSGVVNPRAIDVMAEVGYDLRSHRSEGIDDLSPGTYAAVVTMGCGDACSHVPTLRREDWDIPDPKQMTRAELRDVRDTIAEHVRVLLGALDPSLALGPDRTGAPS